jgi:MFS superfamily sulfate permease-like transporter
MKNIFRNAINDIPASLVVFLVALPLCLGIALGSNAPLFSGIIAGIVGGIVVGALSGSQLSVSGPAAGLTVIVAAAIAKLPAYEAFLLAVVIAGIIQVMLGKLNAGVIGDFIPSSVIKGMLAAIGIILIMKQFPHLIGYDADFEGDETFIQTDGENTFSELIRSVGYITPVAVIIGFLALVIQIVWETPFFKSNKILSLIPSALIVVATGVVINYLFTLNQSELALGKNHLVSIPVSSSFSEFGTFFTFPQIKYLSNIQVWISALTIGIVASLESLLSLEATDNLDPYKRVSPPNRELVAQGAGNIVSGLIGGLPVTAVIVRSSANVNAGAKSKLSAILHGVLLLLSVYFIPQLLNFIPLAALAGVLMFVGFKLAKPKIFIDLFKKGVDQFVPFVVTIIAILLTDLLVGILIGMLSGLYFTMRSNFKNAIFIIKDGTNYLVRFRSEVSFLNKSFLKTKLEEIPDGSYVLIDGTKSNFIDGDIVEVVQDFMKHCELKNIKVEFKTSTAGREKILLDDISNAG